MRITAVLAIVLVATTLACYSVRIPQKPPSEAAADQFEIQITTDRSTGRFNLTLISHSRRQLCLHRQEWPDESGQLHFGGARGVYVEMDGARCNALDENLGYCPGGKECRLRIAPGGELTGFIDFSQFDCDLDNGAALKLLFSISPTYCQ